jgi:hypothetical protein
MKLKYNKPIPFKEMTIEIAKFQKEYITLPAWCSSDKKEVISCWKIGILNRIKLLFTGKIWLRVWSFGAPLQPQLIETDYPFIKPKDTK